MKVLLNSKNRSILDIVNLCCEKVGFTLIQEDSDNFDIAIKDIISITDLVDNENKTIFLIPLELHDKFQLKHMLIKPFLPTDLMNILKEFSHKSLNEETKQNSATEKTYKITDFDNKIESINNKINFVKEDEEILSPNLNSTIPIKFNDNCLTKKPLETNEKSESYSQKCEISYSKTECLEKKIKHIDEIDDDTDLEALANSLEGENIDFISVCKRIKNARELSLKNSNLKPFFEEDEETQSNKDINFNEETTSVNVDFGELSDKFNSEFKNISDLVKQIDDLPNSISNLEQTNNPYIAEDKFDSSLDQELSLLSKKENEAPMESILKQDSDEKKCANLVTETNQDKILEDLNKNTSMETNYTNADINNIKNKLEETVKKSLVNSLNESTLKEILKDMNIKISISFEDK